MLSRNFLEKIGREKGLSKLQQDVFCEKFVDTRPDQLKSNEVVAESLEIPPKKVTNAMSRVYIKFGLEQPGPNKAYKLLGKLLNQQDESHANEHRGSQAISRADKAGNSLQRSPILKLKDTKANQLKRKINKLPSIQKVIENRQSKSPQKKLTYRDKISIVSKLLDLPEREVKFFFNAEPLSRNAFISLAEFLREPWIHIADGEFTDIVLNDVSAIRARTSDNIRRQCGTLRTLDIEVSIEIDELYVDVNILKSLTARQRKSISDLPTIYNANKDRVERSALGDVDKPRIPGDKAALENQKLMIFGKPGSGKTTFLKHIAMMCNQELFQPHRIPIFIQLRTYIDDAREIQDPNIKSYIKGRVIEVAKIEDGLLENLIQHGRLLILLDGLDEVPDEEASLVRSQIRKLSHDWGKNRIIVTCRIAASEHTFDNFTEVEISDFDTRQVKYFSQNWFSSRFNEHRSNALFLSFMENIQKPENEPIREIAVTPILLILTCLVFQSKGKFPNNRYKLYEEGIEILIKSWDKSRDIERQNKGIYKELTVQEKQDLLSHIASTTFEESEYFFERSKLWFLISEYININLLGKIDINSSLGQEEFNIVINSIQVQHGLLVERARNIYSFSHLTFQEYFTAKKIAKDPESEIAKKCIDQITDNRFLEVFLLSSEMMGQADLLLNKRKKNIDNLLINDNKQQKFLQWLQQKAQFDNLKRPHFLLRAFYFDCYMATWGLQGKPEDTLSIVIKKSMARIFKETNSRKSVLDSDYALMKLLGLIFKNRPPYKLSNSFFRSLSYYLHRAIRLSPDIQLQHELTHLHKELPAKVKFPTWWKDQAIEWTKNFRYILKQYRHLGYDWRFDKQQKQVLLEYYNAHIGLVHRLNTTCAMSLTLQEELHSKLLLPRSSL